MSHSSRQWSSKRAYADTSDSRHVTYDDYEDYSRPLHPHYINEAHSALPSRGSYRSHGLYDGHRGYHPSVSSENREPRDITAPSHKITVTRYRIIESATPFYDSREEYTAYDNHRSSAYYGKAGSRNNSNDSYLQDRERGHHQEVPRPSQPKEPKPTYTDGHFSKSKGYSNHKHATNDIPSQGKPESGRSRRQEKSHRSESRRGENPRSNRYDPSHEDREQRYYGSSNSKGYSNHKHATNDIPSQGKPESGRSRRQEKSHRSESRRGENPRSNRNDPSHEDRKHRYHQEVPLSKAEEKMPDHYATLKLGPFATDEEIKSAAKRRRVEVHPDKLKKEGMSESERAKIDEAAAKVGQAADVLQNLEQKREYDRKLHAANGWNN